MIEYSTASIFRTNRRLAIGTTALTVNALMPADWPAVRAIYQEGIATGQATFETAAPDWQAWDNSHRADCRLVARRDGRVVGWTALSPVSWRSVFGGVAEVSIYVAAAARRQGIGRALLTALVADSEAAGLWTLQSGIFPENEASVALHLSCGFHIIGRRERLGFHQGVWRDALLLERRSSQVGVAGQ
ncbi:MAG: N-acetyltransferase [Candidatus Promineofilum sp.]|nr:N-acetyltransferase [Promineifilum sp.]